MAMSTDAGRFTTPVTKLLLIGLLFHLVYIGTVFDCYFTSPVVHGMKRYGMGVAGAKRLVLIVGMPPFAAPLPPLCADHICCRRWATI